MLLCCSATKACIAAAMIFVIDKKTEWISIPHALVYFGIVIFFVYFKLSSMLLGIHDPFLPFENLFCALFLGGVWDALSKIIAGQYSLSSFLSHTSCPCSQEGGQRQPKDRPDASQRSHQKERLDTEPEIGSTWTAMHTRAANSLIPHAAVLIAQGLTINKLLRKVESCLRVHRQKPVFGTTTS